MKVIYKIIVLSGLFIVALTSYANVCVSNQTKDISLGFDFGAFCFHWWNKADGPSGIHAGEKWCYKPDALCRTKHYLQVVNSKNVNLKPICHKFFASSDTTVYVKGSHGKYTCQFVVK